MMGLGMALGEVTLVLFTTLAPSGTAALIIMAVVLLMGHFDQGALSRINQFLCIPLVITMVGLVASATHLGNPSNALYVFMGVGRSPLSNEVFSAVVFLGFAGGYWLYSFTRARRIGLERAWLVLIVVAGLVFLYRLSTAYSVDTIITWNSAFVPASLLLNSLIGGPAVALLSLDAADRSITSKRLRGSLCLLSAGALLGNLAVLCLYGVELGGLSNSITRANDLVVYPAFVAAFGVMCGAGVFLDCPMIGRQAGNPQTLKRQIISCVLIFFGIFAIRFAFYMLHMTVGLAV